MGVGMVIVSAGNSKGTLSGELTLRVWHLSKSFREVREQAM